MLRALLAFMPCTLLLGDFRVQPVAGPVYVSYDFGFSTFPCISSGYEDNDKKVMPSVDVYFYQFPFEPTPDIRMVYGLGARIGL
jgi:hypothetical protein